MELILVRHAEPAPMTVAEGHADPGLTALGFAQAEALAACPALQPVDVLVQSPARRAIETARPLAERVGLVPLTMPDLTEWDWGAAEYASYEDIRIAGQDRWQAFTRGEFGAVDAPAFRARVVAAFAAIAAENPGRRVVAVAHGGVINTFLCDVLGIAADFFFHPAHTSFSRVAVTRDGRRGVLSVNESPHLLALTRA
jgi:broad specificity phosphatase PhoE